MIPAGFEYTRPASLEEALAILAGSDGSTRAIAGGQSLLPLMKLRLARPAHLVDIGRFGELRGVTELADERLSIGALTTWSELLEDPRVIAHGALRDAIPRIGDVAVRNRGTIGGSLAHADPAADIAAPMLALEAELIVRSAVGERTIRASDLFLGPFTTSLAPGELVTEVRLPAASPTVASAYVAVDHPASGYPIAGAAVVLGRGQPRGGAPTACRIGVTGVGERPYRAEAAEAACLAGGSSADAARAAAVGQRVLSDPYADRQYRAAMAAVVVERAMDLAGTRGRAGRGPRGESV